MIATGFVLFLFGLFFVFVLRKPSDLVPGHPTPLSNEAFIGVILLWLGMLLMVAGAVVWMWSNLP